jgi:hypothetical protein
MVSDATSADESSLTARGAGDTDRQPDSSENDAGNAGQQEGVRQCMPCRGTGKVISNLGGKRTELPCPWCGGTGTRQLAVDAQAAWREAEGPRGVATEDDASPEAGAAGA